MGLNNDLVGKNINFKKADWQEYRVATKGG